jgi:putative metallohydrolase (TIGR04338 family)
MARDSQRGRVYAAERHIEWEDDGRVGDGSLQAAEEFVGRITRSNWWRKRAQPYQFHITVKDGRGNRKASAGPASITLPRWARKEWVVLHELAHCLSWDECRRNGEGGHGRTFVRTYLALVDRFLGKDTGRVMREVFREHRVKWSQLKKSKPGG